MDCSLKKKNLQLVKLKKNPKKPSKETNWKSQYIVTSKINVETKLIFTSKSDIKAKFRETKFSD